MPEQYPPKKPNVRTVDAQYTSDVSTEPSKPTFGHKLYLALIP